MNTGAIMVSRRELEESGGSHISEVWGNPNKKRYWTPDGREIYRIPQMRTFVRKDANGKVIEQGLRDANFDEGFLEQRPQILKLYCKHCDKWHDTEEEIEECGIDRKKLVVSAEKKARKEMKLEEDRVGKLEKDVGEMKEMFVALMEKLNG